MCAAPVYASFNNDDSCDIAVMPAATLLLPYFEVDLENATGDTTIFHITNVTNVDTIARVTLWTDRSYPVVNFNIYLTGYDVQGINLFDVLSRGVIADVAGTGTDILRRGKYSDRNPNLQLDWCDRLPGIIDYAYVVRMQDAFTHGEVDDLGLLEGCTRIGGEHDRAIGYATIDVVRACTAGSPAEEAYWTGDLAYDNVLIGEYWQVNSFRHQMQSGPLVHIRAVPEGGTAQERRAHPEQWDAGFARTFYSRFQPADAPKLDGRQPLPSTFAARWIAGSDAKFETFMKVWREGRTRIDGDCDHISWENTLPATELVAFDEHENAVSSNAGELVTAFPATSRTSVTKEDVYPQLPNGASAGWMYFNLDARRRDDFASQAWVIASMRAENDKYTVDVEATAFGTGCTPPAQTTEISWSSGPPLAPAKTEESCDIALLPAATLLLPYFEVDLGDVNGTTTLFTVTNAGPSDQLARVTLWTNYGYPVASFHLPLTGYDMQSINLRDVIAHGSIAPDAARVRRGRHAERNPALDLGACSRGPATMPEEVVTRMQRALLEGVIDGEPVLERCREVGDEHENAVGYATIDVVRNCEPNLPTSADYWTRDIAHDNVLIGDYQQILPAHNAAQANPMVHIRSVEGLERTFYARHQSPATPALDRRQPLPSTFAARWHAGASLLRTSLKIWRDIDFATACGAKENERIRDIVVFDESETAAGFIYHCRGLCFPDRRTLPNTSNTGITDDPFPLLTNGASHGWMYLNLADLPDSQHARQAWVTVSTVRDGKFASEVHAAALGNGCTPPIPESEATTAGGIIIGPAPNGTRP